MPNLWCRLYVRVHHRKWQREAFRYDTCLKRSQGRPLSLVICFCANDVPDLRSLLQPYTNQITSLDITFINPVIRPELLFQDLQALQELKVTGSDWDTSALVRSIPSTFRSLEVKGLSYIVGLSHFGPLWAHLTTVEIVVYDPHVLFELLQLGSNLSSLSVNIQFNRATHPLEPYTHTKLQSLYIFSTGRFTSNPLLDLFNALTLSNLRALEAHHGSLMWPYDEFKAFLGRSNCPLEYLILVDGLNQRMEWGTFPSFFPSLHEVTMDPTRDTCFVLKT